MKLSAWAWIGLTVCATTVACSSNDATTSKNATENPSSASSAAVVTSTVSARPTLTDPKLQPPSQKDNKYAAGLPVVVFDPCTWISDQTIEKAGFDPASRQRIQDMVAEQTFLTCEFTSKTKDLRINSANVPWDQDLQKNAAWGPPITVSGRQAIWNRDTTLHGTCEIDLRTKAGFVQIATDLNQNATQASPCDGLLDIATAIEPEIGKDN